MDGTEKMKPAACVLCGGLSRRFGSPKAEARFLGKRFIDHVVERIRSEVSEIIAVVREGQRVPKWPVDRIARDRPDLPPGPLRGVVAGLEAAQGTVVFILCCDMPFVRPELLVFLKDSLAPCSLGVCCTYGEFIQSFPALYRKAALGKLKSLLDRGSVAPRSAFELPEFQVLSEDGTRGADPEGESFININTPGDLKELRF